MESQDHSPAYPGVIVPGSTAPPAASETGAVDRVGDGPIHPGSGRRIDWRRLFAPLGAAAVLLAKLGVKLKAILILLPKLKLLSTSATMLVSVAAYSLIWGWKFALGFVLLIFVHEMGHVIQLRREGVPASAPMFIPFLGAVIAAKSLGRNALAEARVGLAGPVLGTAGAAAVLPLAALTGNDFWRALAFSGFLINLFNLLPVVPLDGGRAMAALSPWMWLIGFALIVAFVVLFPNPIMVLIAVFGALESWRRWQARNSAEGKEYYRVSPRNRLLVALVYLGLIALLAVGMTETHIVRHVSDA
jgi:Zn-dependent protease